MGHGEFGAVFKGEQHFEACSTGCTQLVRQAVEQRAWTCETVDKPGHRDWQLESHCMEGLGHRAREPVDVGVFEKLSEPELV
jgi:hypothetical protein